VFPGQGREDFKRLYRLVSKFWKFERRTTVEEKDMQMEPDEEQDVEGHVELGQTIGKEDDEDVEAHGVELGNVELGNVELGNVELGREDDGDDVEGHVNAN
jgi:hypothetical protein